MARRGDRIRCTVMFENQQQTNGRVQVFFTLNGKKVVIGGGEDQIFIDRDQPDQPLFPYIGMTEGSSVLAKVSKPRTSGVFFLNKKAHWAF